MQPLLSLLLSLSGNAAGAAVARKTRSAGYIILAGVLLFTAYLAGVAALAVYLAEHMSPWAALAVLAGSLVVAAGAVLLIGAWQSKAVSRPPAAASPDPVMAALDALSGFAADGSPRSLLVAAVAGLVAGSLLDAKRRQP